MSNIGYQHVVRPVVSLGKLYSTLTLPAFSVLTNEPLGNCLSFEDTDHVKGDLANDYDLTADPAATGKIFFDLWVKPISIVSPQTQQVLFKRTIGSGGGLSTTFALVLEDDYDVQFLLYKNAGTSTALYSQFKVIPGEWNHIGICWDGSVGVGAGKNGRIWVNGRVTDIPYIANTTGTFNNDTPVVYSIGGYPSGTITGKCYVDELRVWDAAPNDDYFLFNYRAPRAHGLSDADSSLRVYFRFDKESVSPWSNDKPTSFPDTFTAGAGAATPTIVSSEEYPSALGSSFPCVLIPLTAVGKNFSFIYPLRRPTEADWSLSVYFTDDEGNDQRYFLWRTSELVGAESYADYAGESIAYANARLEVWYNWLDRTCVMLSPLILSIGIRNIRTSFTQEASPNLLTLIPDTTIHDPFPLTFPITFDS